jgi:hypothetical protein
MRALTNRFPAAVLGAFAAMLFLAFAARAQEAVPPQDAEAARNVIEQQLSAFRAGNGEAAYSHAAPGIRRLYGVLTNPQAHVFGRNTAFGGEVHQEVIVTGRDGKQWQAVYSLARQEDGSWKITGVKMNPYKGVTA